ncbi:methyl-accepting chemotaxis protein [Pseudobacteriovorax antillogorgiicola]|uniref:Methyl-accepting chemotaxis protein n=1 Tax=Pseudobacteriovorax antillogorgiicola TaxID=1513793 RepID=A0A1Y6CVS0_9BACT|nr:methyl-accepting chemotaxis protein [Pseudobacteriovorax antillogorgiicola]TCS44249.1 methyl-accepting chemotaxis protein [Pseudobacteriovorax antillogorgiicola]SMF80735.1 Methyl-accepting chemotaxis protein [Pseudobacteriovorax antillogorgiicola]
MEDLSTWNILKDLAVVLIPIVAILVGLFLKRARIKLYLVEKSVQFNLSLIATCLLMALVATSIVSEFYMNRLGIQINELVTEDIPLIKKISDMELKHLEKVVWLERAIIYQSLGDETSLSKAVAESKRLSSEIEELILAALELSKEGVELAHNEAALAEYSGLVKKLSNLGEVLGASKRELEKIYESLSQRKSLNREDLDRFDASQGEFSKLAKNILFDIETYTLQTGIKIRNYEKKAEMKIMVIAFGSLLMAIGIVKISSSILNTRLEVNARYLDETTVQMGGAIDSLVNSSSSLRNVSNDTKAALSHTTSAMAEISSINKCNFEKFKDMQTRAESLKVKVTESNRNIDSLLSAIETIQSAASEIRNVSEIMNKVDKETKAIHEIVFKTQLLSVNASIEASQAGELGKGFSVVADEISKLANLSSSCTESIDDLLSESTRHVENISQRILNSIDRGVSVTQAAAELFGNMNAEISALVSSTDDAFQALEEQNVGVKSVEASFQEMNLIASREIDLSLEVDKVSESVTSSYIKLQEANKNIASLIAAKNRSDNPNEEKVSGDLNPSQEAA